MGKLYLSGIVEPLKAPSTLPPIGTALNDFTWEQIRAISDAGEAANYFSVGDTKTITINGTVGATTFSNLSIDAFIIGINHNESIEGPGIHFKIGKISGTQVALVDSNYDNTGSSSAYFQMNASRTNSGGWNGSNMRKTILGNDGTPSSPLSNSLLAALPSDLLSVMKHVTKYTNNTGGNYSVTNTETNDYLWLLTEMEVWGTNQYASLSANGNQLQYDYYKAGNSSIHSLHSSLSTSCSSWLRDPSRNESSRFILANEYGSCGSYYANCSYGISPAFAV